METLRAKETYCFYCQGCMTRLLEDRWGADGWGRVPRLENGCLYTALLRRKRSLYLLMARPRSTSDSSGEKKKKLMDGARAGVHSCQADWVRVIVLVRHKGLRCLLKKNNCVSYPVGSAGQWYCSYCLQRVAFCSQQCDMLKIAIAALPRPLALWLYFSAITH